MFGRCLLVIYAIGERAKKFLLEFSRPVLFDTPVLHEKCIQNTEIGLNTEKYGPEKTPYLDTFHAVIVVKINLKYHKK